MNAAQRWTAALGDNAWAPGMLVTVPWSVGGDYPKARQARLVLAPSFPGITGYMSGVGCVGIAADCEIDLDDDATKGAALGILRRITGKPRLHFLPHGAGGWYIDDGVEIVSRGETEGDALALAAEAWRAKR